MTNLGYIQTEEHKRKRVKSRMGYQHTQETKDKTGRTKKQEESHRIEHFSKYGFRTLVIWESELKNIKQLKKKLLKFHNDIS
jgi:G:T-mismatch repair DNA endonuclease (very short patch repair protein)